MTNTPALRGVCRCQYNHNGNRYENSVRTVCYDKVTYIFVEQFYKN